MFPNRQVRYFTLPSYDTSLDYLGFGPDAWTERLRMREQTLDEVDRLIRAQRDSIGNYRFVSDRVFRMANSTYHTRRQRTKLWVRPVLYLLPKNDDVDSEASTREPDSDEDINSDYEDDYATTQN